MRNKILSLVLLVVLCAGGALGQEEDPTLLLEIGEESLKGKAMDILPGQIFSAREGRAIPFSQMIREMAACRFVYLGESHNSLPMHSIQARVIRALKEKGVSPVVGLEMFPVTEQEVLTKWSLGILDEDEFLEESRWYVHWNFHFGYYREIFLLAKELSLPVYALNVPRDIISSIRIRGWDALSEEEKALVPEPDLSHEEHRRLIRTVFEATEIPHQMKGAGLNKAFEGLYRAQSAWDETMARYAIRAAKKEDRPVVVLAGSGHLLYNLGINRRVFQQTGEPFRTLICVVVPQGNGRVRVSRTIGDYVWGLPPEERPAFPSTGLAFKNFEGLDNLVISRDPLEGAAKEAGFKKGDVILSVDGESFRDIHDLRAYLARFTWGDEATFRLLRGAGEVEVVLRFESGGE